MNISLITLAIVFLLIAFRQIGNVRLHIWQVMTLGAGVVLVTRQITPRDALLAINLDVILFLFGMFVIGYGLEESGYLAHISYKYFKRAHSVGSLLLFILFGFGCASAFFMNDTLAIIGTPVVLLLAQKHEMSPKLLLLALASTRMILGVSVLLSQFISNVPMVALYQPLLLHAGASIKGFMALAAGSTIAGNLFILGAASNIIIIQNAEKKSHHTFTFWDFAKVGVPLTMMNIIVYWLFLSYF